MNGNFVTMVFVVWGILEIILFFKIWGMTNNITALKKRILKEDLSNPNTNIATTLRRKVLLGDIDDAKKILLKKFMTTVEYQFSMMEPGHYDSERQEYVDDEESNKEKSIRPYVEKLAGQFEKIGEQLPVYIARMNTYKDYFELFTKEEFA